jgi:hypothetical protein
MRAGRGHTPREPRTLREARPVCVPTPTLPPVPTDSIHHHRELTDVARAGGWCLQPGLLPINEIDDASGRIWPVGKIPGRDLRGINLRRASCWVCFFSGCRLREADLTGATLHWCDLTGAKLNHATLHNARIESCDLRRADLLGTDLTGATFDRLTSWPAVFDPLAHGARLESRFDR